jgi:hydrogenase maturation protein HypF
VRAEIKVNGIVQGVGFRPFVYRAAIENHLVGYVRNRGDAHVEIVVEGARSSIDYFLRDLKEKKPPLARIHNITTEYHEEKGEFEKFDIIKSSKEVKLSGSVIPPDVSICPQCLKELRTEENPRHDYFFITCTDCGPRYTIIETLPYDRQNTTMKEFPMCPFCKSEFTDPLNRRFHAQTIACPKCGPRAYLVANNGQAIDSEDPIREAGKLLEEGNILSVKGYGGFHVAAATTKDEPILRLRTVKHRTNKPFAIMARNIEAAKSFAYVNPQEEELLTSYVKPIVLLRKNENYFLSSLIAPGLHNVGVMLPYTGLHYMLFDKVNEPAFIMTSANPPNEPIVTDNIEAIRKLGNIVDYFLFHTRQIAQRCDDSVIRIHKDKKSLIRRSRGYAPEPILLGQAEKNCVLGVGAELNATSCIVLKDKAFMSQHIGDVENLETFEFLKNATKHILRLVNTRPVAVACDLHPKFTTTMLAHEFGQELSLPVIGVQHHHAHGAALIAEHGLNEIIAITCDGYGYGTDGSAWGGEILHCKRDGTYQRVAHLEPQPLVGGDLATQYPLRLAVGILGKADIDVQEWLFYNAEHLPHGKEEAEIIVQQLGKSSLMLTTSCGRVLDAVSSILGLCYQRTYEGEPAMKLESAAVHGRDILNSGPILEGNILKTTPLVQQIFEKRKTQTASNLAFSAQQYLAEGLASLAVAQAKQIGVCTVGFSGGVASNEHITLTIGEICEQNGLRFVVHESLPPGDGGLSFGQAVAAAWQMKP